MVFESAIIPLFISALSAFIVSKIGNRLSLIDIPNERSSHLIPTPRVGGVGIWVAFIFVGFLFTKEPVVTLLLGVSGLLGLLEDIFGLSSRFRLSIQFIIAIAAVWLLADVPDSMPKLLSFLFLIIFITGTTNFYNFMDGINGIAALTSIVGFGLISIFAYFVVNEHDIVLMGIALVSGCLGFLPFNFPKARVFMGDVGSVFLGFVFAFFVVKLSGNLSIFLCLIMFLCTFYADAVVTIYHRWQRGENLMEAHRSHLYQYLSNELQLPHWKVSIMYASIQLIFGLLAILTYKYGLIWQVALFGIFGCMFLITYAKVKAIKPKVA